MTNEEAVKILMNAYENQVSQDGRGCSKTNFRIALLMGINAIGVLEQIRWERDIALFQLEQLGLGLGQKIDGVYLRKEEYEKLKGCLNGSKN